LVTLLFIHYHVTEEKSLHFIEQIIEENLANGFEQDKLRFRFPQSLMGIYIGHAKSICLVWFITNTPVNLRFDDTNPAKREVRRCY
jgi:glutaminyl-tRNA synthetase